MSRITSAAVLLAGVSTFALPSIAGAQVLEEVIVTGSRVIKNGDNSPTPVTVLATEDMQVIQPATIADNLNNLPVFSGSRNQYGNPNPAGGNGAANQLNLRNLGANRNLILYDGHRVPPTLTDGTVDVDMIPQALIQRVDMVTGGVSAVYGSDAISGVINFVTNRNFNGIKANVQYGASEYGDSKQYNAGIAFGMNVGDRGHFEGSYEYRDDKGVDFRSARPWDQQWAATGLGSAAFPYYLTDHVRLAQTAFGGLIRSGVLNGQVFKTNGELSTFVNGQPTGSAGVQIGGDGAYYDASLKAPLKSQQLFGRFDFDFTDDLHGYAVASANLKTNSQARGPIQLQNITISSTNGFLSPTYRAQLAAANQTTFRMSEFMGMNAPRLTPETQADQYFFNAGLEGKLGNYDWDVSYVRGMTRQETITRNNVRNDYLRAAIDATQVTAANVGSTGLTIGSIVCNVALTNPGLYPGCAPLNLFGPTAASAAAIDYIHDDTSSVAHQNMDDVAVTISGETFSTWAGPIISALSAEWRRLTLDTANEALDDDVFACTGLRFNCVADTSIWQNAGNPLGEVTQSIKEAAFEFDAPLLKDVPGFQSLNLNGAVRYTSYSTSGDYTTWKVGLDWHINDEFRFRGTTSRDIRAPTLNELFQPQTVGLQTSTDLLTGQTPTVPIYGGGNADLTAEIGETSTAGLVWKPLFVPGFSLALDGYHINITNALSSVMGTVATAQEACYDSGGSSLFCTLQTRPGGFTRTPANMLPGNQVTSWSRININIANVKTYGLDLEANYTGTLLGRRFSARGFVNWQPHLYFNTPGLLDLDHGGVAYSTNALYPAPQVKTSLMLNYSVTDRFTIAMMEKWRSSMTMKNNPNHIWINDKVASIAYTSLNFGYDLFEERGKAQVFVNVQNVFDKNPPPAAFYSAQTQPGQFGGWAIGDDPIGRYWTLGLRVKL
jgi:iron complex outermembrane recepter protein